jgi:hypothetical protein
MGLDYKISVRTGHRSSRALNDGYRESARPDRCDPTWLETKAMLFANHRIADASLISYVAIGRAVTCGSR